jgi:hypothetical protein
MTESRAAGSVGGVGRTDLPAECSAATSAPIGDVSISHHFVTSYQKVAP